MALKLKPTYCMVRPRISKHQCRSKTWACLPNAWWASRSHSALQGRWVGLSSSQGEQYPGPWR